jgi:hypothetical protein
VPPSLSLLEVLAAKGTNILTNLLVLEGNEFVRLEVELGCGISNEIHFLTPFM